MASRIDPLAIQAGVPVFHHKDNDEDWTTDEAEAKKDKGKPVLFSRSGGDGKGKASSINHSNIAPSIDELAGGVTFDYAMQTTVISIPALRRLRFAGRSADAANAAHVTLAALALAAIVHQRAQGYDLRSRCLLVPEGALGIEAVLADGETTPVQLDAASANALMKSAAEVATSAGFKWEREPIKLKPAPKLVALVKKSREASAAGTMDAN